MQSFYPRTDNKSGAMPPSMKTMSNKLELHQNVPPKSWFQTIIMCDIKEQRRQFIKRINSTNAFLSLAFVAFWTRGASLNCEENTLAAMRKIISRYKWIKDQPTICVRPRSFHSTVNYMRHTSATRICPCLVTNTVFVFFTLSLSIMFLVYTAVLPIFRFLVYRFHPMTFFPILRLSGT